nr:MAG TPA: hypothetical protein [Bacteriophage sp.]
MLILRLLNVCYVNTFILKSFDEASSSRTNNCSLSYNSDVFLRLLWVLTSTLKVVVNV